MRPLPTGITVLEASAGTGKTYTIAALAARYVAEGTPLDRLLLVTFTRMATGELRDRVRERLVITERGLSKVLAGGSKDGLDDVTLLLASAGCGGAAATGSCARWRDFDSATIATTHGFCQEVLGGLGVAGDLEPDAELVEDESDLLGEVVDDLYVRRYMDDEAAPRLKRSEAWQIAYETIRNPGRADRAARGAGRFAPGDARAAGARGCGRSSTPRKRALSMITYDDLLTRLRSALLRPPATQVERAARRATDVVLVDEFQDTDPIQWEILERAFGRGVTLVLIGDPKQAIYAFRGADVYSYLRRAKAAAREATLDVNYRSDQALIDAYDAMFGGAQLGDPQIVYLKRARAAADRAAASCRARRCGCGSSTAPIPSIEKTGQGYAGAQLGARLRRARPGRRDLVSLLETGGVTAGRGGGARPLQPPRQALIRDALDALDVPSVISGAGSVFGTPAAREWLRLLEALERPASPVRARAATMTSFLGWTRRARGDRERGRVGGRPPPAARVGGGAAPARARVADRDDHADRAAAGPRPAREDGERQLTDLRHVGQLLHSAALDRAARDGGAGGVAARARRGRRARGRRGAQPAPGVRRRGGAGADDPPRQGARVPGRLRAVPVGADVGRREAEPDRLPRPRPRADQRTIDVGLEGARLRRAQATRRSRSSAGRTCGSPTWP